MSIWTSFKKKLKDSSEFFGRNFVEKHTGFEKYKLGPTQVYPLGKNLYPTLKDAITDKFKDLDLKMNTPVSSIGSCFAEEFAYYMKSAGYNYITEENDKLLASANWGRVYTVPNLLQIARYSFDDSYPVIVEKTSKGWVDPLRESQPMNASLTKDEAKQAVIKHREASRRAFSNCEVLIITLGQNEAWYNSTLGLFWAKIPSQTALNSPDNPFSVKEFDYSENTEKLKQAIALLTKNNPELKIVFTVSPVAAYASFSDDDVISSSFANKCLLRSVVNEVVKDQPGKLFYFPSFEMVLCNNPLNFRADNRHVKYSMVGKIFSLFSSAVFK